MSGGGPEGTGHTAGFEPSDELVEILAQAIHEDYLRRRGEASAQPGTDDALAHWDHLPETLRHSNRDQARDVGRKLATLGWEVVPAGDPAGGPLVLAEGEVEELARAEHERWTAERLSSGWQPGPQRDAARRTSPYLVDWESLDDGARDLDRDAVRRIPALLVTAGLSVARGR